MLAALCCIVVSCSDKWDDHYDARNIVSADIEIYSGDVAAYMKSPAFAVEKHRVVPIDRNPSDDNTRRGIYARQREERCLDMSVIDNDTAFVKNSISDIAVSPDKLTQNFGYSYSL